MWGLFWPQPNQFKKSLDWFVSMWNVCAVPTVVLLLIC